MQLSTHVYTHLYTLEYTCTHWYTLYPHSHPQSRIRIHFINELGVEEAGVDGGGIFKEFIELVVQYGFSPNRAGVFKVSCCCFCGGVV